MRADPAEKGGAPSEVLSPTCSPADRRWKSSIGDIGPMRPGEGGRAGSPTSSRGENPGGRNSPEFRKHLVQEEHG